MFGKPCALLAILIAAQASAIEPSTGTRFQVMPVTETDAADEPRHRFRLSDQPGVAITPSPTGRFVLLGQALPKGGGEICVADGGIFKNGFEN